MKLLGNYTQQISQQGQPHAASVSLMEAQHLEGRVDHSWCISNVWVQSETNKTLRIIYLKYLNGHFYVSVWPTSRKNGKGQLEPMTSLVNSMKCQPYCVTRMSIGTHI